MLVNIGTLMNPQAPRRRSAYTKQIEEILQSLKSETQLVSKSEVANFLYYYFASEALAKLVQGFRQGCPPGKALTKSVHLRTLTTSLKHCGIKIDEGLLRRVFNASHVGVQNRSARRLRDKIVHELSRPDLNEIQSRGSGLMNDMKSFVLAVENTKNKSGVF